MNPHVVFTARRTARSRIVPTLVCLALVCLSCVFPFYAALAVDETPQPTTVPVQDDSIFIPRYGVNKELMTFKSKLWERSYYDSLVSESMLNAISHDFLDDYTMNAIRNACRVNSLSYNDNGITNDMWSYVLTDKLPFANATPTPSPKSEDNFDPTPSPDPWSHIYWGEHGENVQMLISKLHDLYYDLDQPLGESYDEALRAAIDRYCEINHISYDQYLANGITRELQMQINAQKSIPCPTATPTPSESPAAAPLSERMVSYFTGTTHILGFGIPTVALWFICIILIVGIVFVMIRMFGSSGANNDDPTHYSEPRGGFTTGRGKVKFTISYMDQQRSFNCDIIDKPLKIGRQIGSFPLFIEDKSVSRKHCEIYYNAEHRLMIRDFSTGGNTYINGRQCARGEYPLNSGDKIRIGNHEIIITF